MVKIGILALDEGAGIGMRRRLESLGWVERKNVIFDYRHAGGETARLPEIAAELVRAKPDVIVAWNNSPAFAAKAATDTIPIVVWGAHDAVGTGLARSLARPGANVTGTDSVAPELDAKRIELLKQIVPTVQTLAVLYNPDDQGSPIHLNWTADTARKIGVDLVRLQVRRAADYNVAFASTAGTRMDALLIFTDWVTFANWSRAREFARENKVPTICEFSQLVEGGCLVSYGPTFEEFNERVAAQVNRILKGGKPEELPFEQPTRFELAVNIKTAKALGIKIPNSILVRADKLIE